jgi:hypothetical protein
MEGEEGAMEDMEGWLDWGPCEIGEWDIGDWAMDPMD